MAEKELIQLFGEQKVRTKWDDEKEKWYFSIVDVCWVLTDQPDYDGAKNYWKVLKFRLKAEGNESVTNCNQLKMVSPKDGKRYKTDVADMEQRNHGVGSPDHIQESDISMLYYLSHSHFI